MRTARFFVVALSVAALALPATADEIIDQINSAVELYKSGDFAGAAGELDFAAAQIRQLRAGEVSGALPAPLSGWTARDAETSAMGASFLQAVSMMLNNPMVMSGSGQKLIRVKGNKAALEWEGDGGSINVVVGGNVLVTIEGRQCTQDDLTAYAEGVDYGMLKEIMAR